MVLIFKFPDAISLEIVSEWLTWRDVGKLDRSVTSEKSRNSLLDLLKGEHFALEAKNVKVKNPECFHKWLLLRKVKVQQYVFGPINLMNHDKDEAFCCDIDLSKTTELTFEHCDYLDSSNILQVTEKCEVLTSLEFHDVPALSDSFIANASTILKQLQSLSVFGHCPSLTNEGFKRITHTCRQLRRIQFEVPGSFSSECCTELDDLVLNNPLLEHIKIIGGYVSDSFLLILINSCKGLKTLALYLTEAGDGKNDNDSSTITVTALGQLITSLPTTQEVFVRKPGLYTSESFHFEHQYFDKKNTTTGGQKCLKISNWHDSKHYDCNIGLSTFFSEVKDFYRIVICSNKDSNDGVINAQITRLIAMNNPSLLALNLEFYENVYDDSIQLIFDNCSQLINFRIAGCLGNPSDNDTIFSLICKFTSTARTATFDSHDTFPNDSMLEFISRNPKFTHVNARRCFEIYSTPIEAWINEQGLEVEFYTY